MELGLAGLCKLSGELKVVGNDGKTRTYEYDYNIDKPVLVKTEPSRRRN